MSKMEFKINASPHLKMSQITKRLFNLNFHADIQFCIENKIIYAHSLELIKRSVVFEQQLEDMMGETKLIPVNDCKYESFFEFVRYIYTDECTINEDNFCDILKLANKYKFHKLENQVINSAPGTTTWLLKSFDFCFREKYEILWNYIMTDLVWMFPFYLTNKHFLTLHPDAVDEFLKFECVAIGVTELQIFTVVVNWITSYCKMHQLTLAEGRQRWDKLIRKIRFPTMSLEELRECYTKYPGLLSDSDRMLIASQAVFGGSDGENSLWISKGREKYIPPFKSRSFQHDTEHKTVFAVSKNMILYGLRIGIEIARKPIEIEILETNDKTKASQKITFVQNIPNNYSIDLVICLGNSIQLKPNFKYAIRIKYLETIGTVEVTCRTEVIDVIINDPSKTVNLNQASANMLEMFFKPPTE